MSTRTMLITLLATALTLPAMAQESTTSAVPVEKAVTVQGSEPVANTVSRDKDTLSVDFPDEDIKTILRNVADLFELNLVVPDTLTGKTSIKLRDVTWRQIFQVVLAPAGYTYIEEANIIKIVSNELLQQEPASTEVFILNNAKAADIKPTIEGLVDAAAGGKIVIDGRSNALVITERPSRMGRIRGIIEQLDKATEQVMIESKFVEVTDRDIRNIGVNWAGLQNMQLSARDITQEFTRDRGQTFDNGTNSTLNSGATRTTGSTSGTNNNSTLGNTSKYETGLADPTSNFASNFNPSTGVVGGLPNSVPTVSGGAGPFNTFNGNTSNGTTATTNNADGSSASSAVNQLMGLTNTGGTSRMNSSRADMCPTIRWNTLLGSFACDGLKAVTAMR